MGRVLSKHCLSKMLIVQPSRPFPGEMLGDQLGTKQSTAKPVNLKQSGRLNARLVMRQKGRQETSDSGSLGFGGDLPQL